MENPILNDLHQWECYSFDPFHKPEKVIFNFLFNHPKHLFLQSKNRWKVFGLKVNGETVAQIAFHLQIKTARSPLKAPFGSLQWAGRVNQKQLACLLAYIDAFFKKTGVKNIVIKNYPEAYHSVCSKLLCKTLTDLGFTARPEVSSVIGVDKNDFESKITTSEKQKLRKSQTRFQFTQVHVSQLSSTYLFIETCRHQKNQSLSMTLPQLQKTIDAFPGDFFLFNVLEGERIVAAAIVIRVSKKILYAFYYAHDKQFDKISPIVFLLAGIYSFAQGSSYKMIDLGTSMKGKAVNQPLLHFKNSIGGKLTPKFIFEKTFQ